MAKSILAIATRALHWPRRRPILTLLVSMVTIGGLGATLLLWRPGTPEGHSLTTAPASPTTEKKTTVDEPLRLLAAARESYRGVEDYSCTFIKRERINGQLLNENVTAMKFRERPFSVNLKWSGPKALVGQEAIYVEGKNNNQLRAKSGGLLSAIGFLSLDPRDARAMASNRHPITDIGIGKLIARFTKAWERERSLDGAKITIADVEFSQRACTRVELLRPDPNSPYSYRTLVYFDKENHLPIRFEAYDRPKADGAAEGELLEIYSYVDLRCNVGLSDRDFSP